MNYNARKEPATTAIRVQDKRAASPCTYLAKPNIELLDKNPIWVYPCYNYLILESIVIYPTFITRLIIFTSSFKPFCLSACVSERNIEATGHA